MLTESTGSGHGATDAVYSYHPHYIDAVAIRMRASDEHLYLHDANFNVTAVTDRNGSTAVERYAYTPYGEATVLDSNFSPVSGNASTIDNELLYTGRRLDPETGLQLNRNRFYAAHLGRWVSRDPIGYDAGLWNLYNYVNSNPVRFTDPTGKLTNWEKVKCVSAAAGFSAAATACILTIGGADLITKGKGPCCAALAALDYLLNNCNCNGNPTPDQQKFIDIVRGVNLGCWFSWIGGK